jgi:hypothetical protein
MHRKTLFTILAIGAIVTFLPVEAFAERASDFGGKELTEQSEPMFAFIFKVVMRIVAGFGAAFGIIRAFLTSSATPILVFGALALIAVMIPTFINGIFGV